MAIAVDNASMILCLAFLITPRGAHHFHLRLSFLLFCSLIASGSQTEIFQYFLRNCFPLTRNAADRRLIDPKTAVNFNGGHLHEA